MVVNFCGSPIGVLIGAPLALRAIPPRGGNSRFGAVRQRSLGNLSQACRARGQRRLVVSPLRNLRARGAGTSAHAHAAANRCPCSRVARKPTLGQRSIVTCRLYLLVARNTGLPSTSVASAAACSRSKLRRTLSSGKVSQRAVAML